MGGIRFGVGLHGKKAIFLFIFIALFYLIWYSILGCLWVFYGLAWLIVAPISWVIKKIKEKTKRSEK